MSTTPETVFRNLIPCDSFEYPFVDDYAQFCVVFERGRPLGPVALQVRSSVLYQSAADALLTVWISDADGTLVPVTRRETEHLPWSVTERGDAPGFEVVARHVFLDERTLVSEFTVSTSGNGTGDSSAGHSIEFRGRFAPDEPGRHRFLAALDKEPSFPEHISSDPVHYAAGGSKDYNWGVAAYLLIAERRYREARPW